MPKATTVSEFDALMAEVLAADAPVKLEVAVTEETKPTEAKVPRYAPVEKVSIDDTDAPFKGSVAVVKGYLNMEFSRSQRLFLYEKQLVSLIEWATAHGQDYLAKAKAAGLK